MPVQNLNWWPRSKKAPCPTSESCGLPQEYFKSEASSRSKFKGVATTILQVNTYLVSFVVRVLTCNPFLHFKVHKKWIVLSSISEEYAPVCPEIKHLNFDNITVILQPLNCLYYSCLFFCLICWQEMVQLFKCGYCFESIYAQRRRANTTF